MKQRISFMEDLCKFVEKSASLVEQQWQKENEFLKIENDLVTRRLQAAKENPDITSSHVQSDVLQSREQQLKRIAEHLNAVNSMYLMVQNSLSDVPTPNRS
eukprot:GHVO01059128.1.p1 GENE.GHVO01059128.1~~GHVO01059128.1.p1  ORF type:complete len:101 (+),score=15.91 GHVO01059128.1:223-525(+)